jgi:hypothetical protein
MPIPPQLAAALAAKKAGPSVPSTKKNALPAAPVKKKKKVPKQGLGPSPAMMGKLPIPPPTGGMPPF